MAQSDVGPALDRTSAARVLVLRRMVVLHRELLRRDGEMRRGVPDAVHQTRVTCRRMRAALATFGSLLDHSVTAPVRAELRWTARSLGEARDAEVAHLRLTRLVDEPDVGDVMAVRARLDRLFRARIESADAAVAETISSARYDDLLVRLGHLFDGEPWTPAARAEVGEVAPPLVRLDRSRMQRRVDRADSTPPGLEHDDALHAVRRAAKRLRYACEALEPAYGEAAAGAVESITRVTRLLGERQDTVISRRVLRGLAVAAASDGESVAAYERLEARERARADECEAAYEQAWRDASAAQLWAWLS